MKHDDEKLSEEEILSLVSDELTNFENIDEDKKAEILNFFSNNAEFFQSQDVLKKFFEYVRNEIFILDEFIQGTKHLKDLDTLILFEDLQLTMIGKIQKSLQQLPDEISSLLDEGQFIQEEIQDLKIEEETLKLLQDNIKEQEDDEVKESQLQEIVIRLQHNKERQKSITAREKDLQRRLKFVETNQLHLL